MIDRSRAELTVEERVAKIDVDEEVMHFSLEHRDGHISGLMTTFADAFLTMVVIVQYHAVVDEPRLVLGGEKTRN